MLHRLFGGRKRLRLGWALVGAPLLGACFLAPTESYGCTTDIQPAIRVEVRDARSGAPLADLAAGEVRAGVYVDALRPSSTDTLGRWLALRAADERPGTYDVEVRRPGFATWRTSGVRVSAGGCHVQTVTVKAALDTLP